MICFRKEGTKVMDVLDIKQRLHKSLSTFVWSIIFCLVVLFIIVLFRKDIWVICLLPAIFIFSVIGMRCVFKSLLRLTEKDGNITEMGYTEYLEKLYGVDGFKATFIVLALLIWISVLIIGFVFSPANFNISAISVAGVVFAVALIYDTYILSQELSFVIMTQTIIKGMKMRKGEVVNES